MAKLNSTPHKADGKAVSQSEMQASFFATMESAATVQGASTENGLSARKTLSKALKSGATAGMTEVAFASFKTDAHCHYLAAYLTSRSCATDYASVRRLWTDGVKAEAHGKALAPVGCNHVADWDTKIRQGSAVCRKLLSNAFDDIDMSIKTNAPLTAEELKDRETRRSGGKKPRQSSEAEKAKAEDHSTDLKSASETIRTAAPLDIAAALSNLPEDVFAQIVCEAASIRAPRGCLKAVNSAFISSLLFARDKRNQDLATPATKCA